MPTIDSAFAELSAIIVIATVIGGLVHLLRQPLMIGHIITGLIVGPYFLNIVHSTETIDLFSQLGIALLLFIVGLSLNPRVIKEVGSVSLVTGVGQVLLTLLIGFALASLLGFPPIQATYIGIALTFSSTIIILKLLSDKKDLNRLYGKIATGFLLVQDLIAVAILIVVSSSTSNLDATTLLTQMAIKGAILLAVISFVTVYILPTLSNFFARNQEFLFLFSLSWGLGLALLFKMLGFSVEIGALAAGITLATSPYNYEISAKLRPLRDFFIILFFILLGSHLSIDQISGVIIPALIFSLVILIGNPIIMMSLMGALGYNKRTGFKAGLTVAQISEFSLVLISMGAKVGQLPAEIVSLITVVALITITASTYMIIHSDALYTLFEPFLNIFERRKPKSDGSRDGSPEIILFGFDQVGHDFLESFQRLNKRFLVIDYDPSIIRHLTQLEIPCKYGDANDHEFLEELSLERAKLVVSTLIDTETNLLIVSTAHKENKKAIIITRAESIEEADQLYRAGATYIMMPHYISSSHTSSLISKHGFDLSLFIKEQEKHRLDLEKRREKEYHHKVVEP